VRAALKDEEAYRALVLEAYGWIAEAVPRYATSKLLRTEENRFRLQMWCEDDLPPMLAAFKGRATLKVYVFSCVRFRAQKLYRVLLTERGLRPSLTPYQEKYAQEHSARREAARREGSVVLPYVPPLSVCGVGYA